MKLVFYIWLGLCISLVGDIRGEETREFLFSSPILYQPVLNKKRAELDLANSVKEKKMEFPIFTTTIELSEISLLPEERREFDRHLLFKYKDYGDAFHLFTREGLIVRIEQYSHKALKHEVLFRNLEKINRSLSNVTENYRHQSIGILKQIFHGDDFLSRLPQGESILSMKLIVDGHASVGEVHFSTIADMHSFFYYENLLRNSALTREINSANRIRFSVSFFNDTITLANVYNDKRTEGYDCSFYPNWGLKFFLPLDKNGKYEWITTWDIDGKNKKKSLLEIWQKEQK